ncbi:MAG: hypothetical protein K0R82_1046 [Flavipsychrobacter sp.]|jgi:hypothetical protein|nr:hypothetical protein [Flavipsychrobacter sp.]
MIKKLLLLLSIVHITAKGQQLTVFEESKGSRSATYSQTIDFYKALDEKYSTIKMQEVGATDVMYPLHVVLCNNSSSFNIEEWKNSGKLVILVNNGIHPGEPDGIDASMMLLRDIASGKVKLPDNVMLAVVPVFNIGGALNRNSVSRTNQNGPEEYGFRGNAQNLDLNRDFIKLDAKETQSLVQLFHKLDPDLFIDNHVSNGADYQHVMTLLSTQHNKLGGSMGKYLNEKLEPAIYADMKKRGYDLVPYVNHWGHTPDKGWIAFHEGPRFASGFTSLFQTYGFVPETHMLKPFKDRVEATYALMLSLIKIASENAVQIKATRQQDRATMLKEQAFTLEWSVDTTQPSTIQFKGYEAGYKPSEVSGQPRLYYDRSKPYTKQIPFYNTYNAKSEISAPKAYVIPQGWGRVIDRLKMNGVEMRQLQRDTVMEVRVYTILTYETAKRPYEGHYLHTNVQAGNDVKKLKLMKGDYIIPLEQRAKRYLIETLEPTAPDAFFAWGFFDAVLQQKEYFSDYVFEDEAAEILKKNPALVKMLQERKDLDAAFASDGRAQLEFVYQNSPHYEAGHMRYPVYRVESD